jgi:electron transfer flavoprotein alpha/beta subunit
VVDYNIKVRVKFDQTGVDIADGKASVTREIDGDLETLSVTLPNIMKAKSMHVVNTP